MKKTLKKSDYKIIYDVFVLGSKTVNDATFAHNRSHVCVLTFFDLKTNA